MNYLKNILYLLITVMVVSFFWPLIKWFGIIIILIVLALLLFSNHAAKENAKHPWNEGSSEDTIYDRTPNHSDDVIDVTYKKKEIKDEE